MKNKKTSWQRVNKKGECGQPRLLLSSAFFIFTLFMGIAKAEIVNLEIIKRIESNGNPLAFNPKSQARGLYQITPICLQEWNNFHPAEQYTFQDLFNPIVNEKIARWYLEKRIPQMLKYYKKEVNFKNILICYNAGIRAVVKGYIPKETRRYIKKYKKLKGGENDKL